ncbi:MAG: prephenate dehydrogenase [Spirochaetota bacterium]
MKKVLIYGLGLMGGSIALTAKKKTPDCTIHGLTKSSQEKRQAIKLGIANTVYTEQEFLQQNIWNNYDLIIYCLPVNLICQKISEIPNHYRGFVTDIGSSKKKIVAAIEESFATQEHNYYSSHPMAGSEHTGCQFAIDTLFEEKLCIMTPPKGVRELAKEEITKFWNRLGMQTVEIKTEAHDEVLAYLSHSPHIISSILVNWSEENKMVRKYSKDSPLPLTGGGFRDMSRIAGSNPEMWDAIINSNQESIYDSLLDFRDRLSSVIRSLEKQQPDKYWQNFFASSQKKRREILKLPSFPQK